MLMRRNSSFHQLNSDLNHDLNYDGFNHNQKKISNISFNSDHHCFTIALENGFSVYSISPFRERFHTNFSAGFGHVELLGRSNIVALVGGGVTPEYPPNKVIIWNDQTNNSIHELEYSTEVTGIKFGMNRLIVSLYHRTYVYLFDNMNLETHYETWNNPNGIMDISPNGEVLVILGTEIGKVRIENLKDKKSYLINAHQSVISKIVLSFNGLFLATVSKRGTIIRVWNTYTGQLFREFRRGVEPTKIISMAFDKENGKLCVAGEKGTVHIFNLKPRDKCQQHEKNRKMKIGFFGGFLPEYFSSIWSSVSFNVPYAKNNWQCSFNDEGSELYIITDQGWKYTYKINTMDKTSTLIDSTAFI